MKKITFLLFTLLSAVGLKAQNDCSTAISVGSGITTVGTIDGAVENSCFSSTADYGEWYSYTPTSNFQVTITTDLPQNDGVTNSDDTRVSIFEGSCSALTCIAANDDVDPSTQNYLSTVTFPALAGTTYYIQWDDRWNADGFDFELTEVAGPTCNPNTLPENFDDLAVIDFCWDTVDSDGDGNNWIVVDYDLDDDGIPDGNPCAVSASYDNNSGALTPDNWLISNAIDLTSLDSNDSAQINWLARGLDASYADENYTVYIAAGNQTTDFLASTNTFTEIIGQTGGAGETYASRSITIDSQYNGQMVYVAFRHHNVTDEFVLNIDNIALAITLDNDSFVENEFKYFYNNNTNTLELSIAGGKTFSDVAIYNTTGQTLLHNNYETSNTSINLAHLASGVYMAKVLTNDGKEKTVKFIK